MAICFLADPRIFYEMKRSCFTLIVVAHSRRLNSFICSVTLLPVTAVALVMLASFPFSPNRFLTLVSRQVGRPVGFTLKIESNI
jgi:hypothetical protein